MVYCLFNIKTSDYFILKYRKSELKNYLLQFMVKVKKIYFIIGMALLTNDAIAQFPLFKDNDRVCFIGNSITMNGKFHNYIELFYATRFPDRKIEFYNCGISGDVSGGMLERMDSDILIHKPTWSVLMVGMNDINSG